MNADRKLDGQSAERQAVLDQFLSTHGQSKRYPPFIAGRALRQEEFIGRTELLQEIRERAAENGIVAIEKGQRSGGTSLIKAASKWMVNEELVERDVFVNLEKQVNQDLPQMEQEIWTDVRKPPSVGKVVVTFDELESFSEPPEKFTSLVNLMAQLRREGHTILANVLGDLQSDVPIVSELSPAAKTELRLLVGDSIVVNRLLDEDETRRTVAGGEPPLFTEEVVQLLIKEAGNHPLLANLVADEMFFVLKDVQRGDLKITDVMRHFYDRVSEQLGDRGFFSTPTEHVIAAGYNPETWEYIGEATPPPNRVVYENMLPRQTSTVYRFWFEKYLAKRKQAEDDKKLSEQAQRESSG